MCVYYSCITITHEMCIVNIHHLCMFMMRDFFKPDENEGRILLADLAEHDDRVSICQNS